MIELHQPSWSDAGDQRATELPSGNWPKWGRPEPQLNSGLEWFVVINHDLIVNNAWCVMILSGLTIVYDPQMDTLAWMVLPNYSYGVCTNLLSRHSFVRSDQHVYTFFKNNSFNNIYQHTTMPGNTEGNAHPLSFESVSMYRIDLFCWWTVPYINCVTCTYFPQPSHHDH